VFKTKTNGPVAGIPMALSLPHFLAADPAVRNSFVGMEPDEKKHSAHVLVEPVNKSN
jgi:hypothetical protein